MKRAGNPALKIATIVAVVLGLACSASTQDSRCQSISFIAELSARHKFEHELGSGVWFTASPNDHAWRMRIGPGRELTGSSDSGWSLDYFRHDEWHLGRTRDLNVDEAMKASPRRLWFAITEKDHRRLSAALQRLMSSNTRVIFSGESDPGKVIDEIPKGLATVVISDYHLSEPQKDGWQGVASAKLTITVNTPSTFPLIDGVPCACPTERPQHFPQMAR